LQQPHAYSMTSHPHQAFATHYSTSFQQPQRQTGQTYWYAWRSYDSTKWMFILILVRWLNWQVIQFLIKILIKSTNV
jgi:hypothetical protein